MPPRFTAACAAITTAALALTCATTSVAHADEAAPAPSVAFYEVQQPTAEQRAVLVASGASLDGSTAERAVVEATETEAAALRHQGIELSPMEDTLAATNARIRADERQARRMGEQSTTQARDFPRGYTGYHTYDEMYSELRQIADSNSGIAKLVTLGKSYEGREILALKISDKVNEDEGEPESLQTCNVHAREHLTAEMCMYLANELTGKYASDDRIRKIVDSRVVWLVPMMNPDGAMYDISGGEFQMWRKNRQPSGGGMGIDLNRNYAYEWGGAGASTDPDSPTYRGTHAEEGVEVKAVTDFVRGRQGRIKTHIDMHTYSELILWPWGYTRQSTTRDMTADEQRVFETFGRQMASTNRYTPEQSSDLYPASGGADDWFWGDQKIWSYTFEMYPTGRNPGFYPDDSLIERETTRNREAVLRMYENTDCMWRVIGQEHRCQNA